MFPFQVTALDIHRRDDLRLPKKMSNRSGSIAQSECAFIKAQPTDHSTERIFRLVTIGFTDGSSLQTLQQKLNRWPLRELC